MSEHKTEIPIRAMIREMTATATGVKAILSTFVNAKVAITGISAFEDLKRSSPNVFKALHR